MTSQVWAPSTSSHTRTQRWQVIYGGIRDAQQIMEIDNFCTFCKGMDPTPIRDVTLVGMNVPCRIGEATCMPGDVVLGIENDKFLRWLVRNRQKAGVKSRLESEDEHP